MKPILTVIGLLLVAGFARAAESKPHLLILLSDDHSQRDLAVYGAKAIRTPFLDRLAAEGYAPADIRPAANHIDSPAFRDALARYQTAVTLMDQELAQVHDVAMKVLGADRTFVLHTSDHGSQLPFGKWTLYDGGIRVPFIAKWPGVIRPATRTTAIVQWMDILPTLVELAGGSPPAGIDGRSFAPVLRGETAAHRDAIFTTHSGDGNFNVYPMRSVRTPDWKLISNLHPEFQYFTHIDRSTAELSQAYWKEWEALAATDASAATILKRYRERPAFELYDLAHDPLELRNLADDPAHAARLAELRNRLEAWMTEQRDTCTVFGDPVRIGEPLPLIEPARNAKKNGSAKK